MKKFLFPALLTVLLLSLDSCTHRLTDFTVISTKNVPLGTKGEQLKKGQKRVKGTHKTHTIIFFPTGTPNMKEAIDRAIEQHPGAVGLVDGVLKHKSWWALLYGQSSYIVEGTPLYIVDDVNNSENHQGSQENQHYYSTTTNQQHSVQSPYYNTQATQQPAQNALLFYHEVNAGESLDAIANQYNVTAGDIIKWNKLNSNNLVKGTKLKIFISE